MPNDNNIGYKECWYGEVVKRITKSNNEVKYFRINPINDKVILALQGGLYQWALTQQNQRFEDRERLNSELFGVYIDGA